MRVVIVFLVLSVSSVSRAQDKADLSIVHRIRAEAFEHSEVMDTLFYLTDVNGPRLTNSTGFQAAADWTVARLEKYGLVNVKQEPSGVFGRSWNWTHYEGHMLSPQYSPLIGFPLAWTSGTDGPVRGDAMLAVLANAADLEKYQGKLHGKMVLIMAPRELEMSVTSLTHRIGDRELAEQELTLDPSRISFEFGLPGGRLGSGPRPNPADQQRFHEALVRFLVAEKPAVVITYDPIQDGGTVFGTGFGSYKAGEPVPPPAVVIAEEHYNRIARLLAHNIPVQLAFDVRAQVGQQEEQSFNIVGEIPGGRKRDEIVMLGGHFDSWHGATGATDNGTGSSVAIEAMRILKSLNVQMDRTVRVALWTGEEQGLLGSLAYVKNHFADRADMQVKPEYAKLSAYYNDDGGTGKLRGIWIGGNDQARPIFEAWLAPFHDLGATAISGASAAANRPPGGTDYRSFDNVGLPGFGFMQDPLEYWTRTHHSNMDLYDRVQKGDLMQAAAIEAAFAYHTAMRAEMMPRAPMPKPRPEH